MKKKSGWFVGLVLLLAAVLAQAAVTFTLAKDSIKSQEDIKVTFNAPLPKSGERYWITVIPVGAADSEWGQWQYVDSGIKQITLKGPASPGKFEVRLHDQYPAKNYHVAYRAAFTVTGGAGAQASAGGISFTLAKSTIQAGAKPKVTFNAPLPQVADQRYWITVIRKGAEDSEWGQWRYVDNGVKEIELEAVPEAGQYEVRLHDQYPAKSYHVVYRADLTVK
jgi:hypothetical protein